MEKSKKIIFRNSRVADLILLGSVATLFEMDKLRLICTFQERFFKKEEIITTSPLPFSYSIEKQKGKTVA